MLAIFLVPDSDDRPAHDRFLARSVGALRESIEKKGGRLDLLAGDPLTRLPELARQLEVDEIHTLRGTLPADRQLDQELRETLGERLHLHPGHTLAEPGSVQKPDGGTYAVFTPFSRRFLDVVEVGEVEPTPRKLPAPPAHFEPQVVDYETDVEAIGQPGGEDESRKRLKRFLDVPYAKRRDRMDLEGSSRLSADFKFGTLSPREAWHAVAGRDGHAEDTKTFRNELIWREFNYTILAARPELLTEPFRANWQGFPWRDDPAGWQAWCEGRTGYPVVDASARQLLAEGFVHNRARMISASFLTKHLLLEYVEGEAHYFRHLADGDPAQNNAGWQWSAGCGCDAQPWFRIFNPITQGKKFDPEGDYVRRWVPELAGLPARWIHEPWNAPPLELASAGITLGKDYPEPIVDHAAARQRFLDVARGHLG
jgi:deoxyribodipyrimidine photo-lyase